MPEFRGRSYQIFLPPFFLSHFLLLCFSFLYFPPSIRFYRLDKSTYACMHAMCHPHGMHVSCHVSSTWHACIMPRVTNMACMHHAMCHPHDMHASCHPPIWVHFCPEIHKKLTIPELTKFVLVTRFREMNPTVLSVSLSEI